MNASFPIEPNDTELPIVIKFDTNSRMSPPENSETTQFYPDSPLTLLENSKQDLNGAAQ